MEAVAQEETPATELCQFFEDYEKEGPDAVLPPGVYTLADLRAFGRQKGWCPYFLARHMISYANVVVGPVACRRLWTMSAHLTADYPRVL